MKFKLERIPKNILESKQSYLNRGFLDIFNFVKDLGKLLKSY